jgi:hypothetical protein
LDRSLVIRSVVWMMAVWTIACGHDSPDPKLPIANPPLPAVLRAYTEAMNNAAIDEVLALLSDDVVVVGLDECKGDPCIGRKAAGDGVFNDVQLPKGVLVRKDLDWKVEGDQVTVHYRATLHYPGLAIKHVRGWMLFTLRDGHIARLFNAFDLTDPQTVVAQSWPNRQKIFALRAPDDVIVGRAIVTTVHKGAATSISIERFDRTVGRKDFVVKLVDGSCEQPAAGARVLHFFEALNLEAIVDTAIDQLFTTPHHLEMLAGDGTRIGCGEIPD